MAIIVFDDDDTEDKSAMNATVYDEWVMAMIEEEDGEQAQYCIPRDNVRYIIGHASGDDLTMES
jgi:hypothetical protein